MKIQLVALFIVTLILLCQFNLVASSSSGSGSGSGSASASTGSGWSSGSTGSSSGSSGSTSGEITATGCYSFTGGSMSCEDSYSYASESSESAPVDSSSDNSDLTDASEFLVGVAAGVIDQVVNKTVVSCFNDIDATLTKFRSGLKLIEDGLDKKIVKDVAGGIADFVAGVNDVKSAYKACNVMSVYNNIESIIKLFGEGWAGAFELVVKEGIKIVHNKVELNDLFNDAIVYWKEQSYYHAGFYSGRIIGVLAD